MKKTSPKTALFLLISSFILSRVILKLLGVSFVYHSLFEYWQYLDIRSLSGNLLNSLWFQHSQPPVFNLLVGVVLKCSGSHAYIAMETLLMVITFCNGLLLFGILRNCIPQSNIPLIFSLLYLLSPATMLYENELFYTSFISMLLLATVYGMVRFTRHQNWQNAAVIFVALTLVCLTKSMYHLVWLTAVSAILLFIVFRKKGFTKLLFAALISVSVVGGWYLKNYLVFGSFSASSWSGMNFSRIVFRDNLLADSNSIASLPAFMPVSYYRNFITNKYNSKYAGFNDRILLMETKNDRFINLNNAGYLEVSAKYMKASLTEVRQNPFSYIKNVMTAFVIFFTPATSYFKIAENNDKIRYYDTLYSFNLSHFFIEDKDKKTALVVSAIPVFLVYALVFFIIIREGFRKRQLGIHNLFIGGTILFTITVSSLFEYGENMRFRYEINPLFLIFAAQAVTIAIRNGRFKRSK